jgi:glycosyltransferase involved in cell wall biosynthesis
MFFSIVMPAYKAQQTILASVQSALRQTHARFELVISSDDQTDYLALLQKGGVNDPRIKQVLTDGVGTGSSNARNVGMDAATSDYIVVLDADDLMVPEKLEICAVHLKEHPLISTGLQVADDRGEPLFKIGCTGATVVLPAERYKSVNLSMDSMIIFDRKRLPISYDVELPCLVDLGLILDAFRFTDHALHVGAPLHIYTKQQGSISNSTESSARYIRIKKELLRRLKAGEYKFAGGEKVRAGFMQFLNVSLAAEQEFEEAKTKNPALLFEDHIKSQLDKAAQL